MFDFTNMIIADASYVKLLESIKVSLPGRRPLSGTLREKPEAAVEGVLVERQHRNDLVLYRC